MHALHHDLHSQRITLARTRKSHFHSLATHKCKYTLECIRFISHSRFPRLPSLHKSASESESPNEIDKIEWRTVIKTLARLILVNYARQLCNVSEIFVD